MRVKVFLGRWRSGETATTDGCATPRNQRSSNFSRWKSLTHISCIDLLAFPHMKNDQVETRQAHPGDSASKPLLFAPRSAGKASKLVRALIRILWLSSLHVTLELAAVVPFELGYSQIPTPHKEELNPWEQALSSCQIRRTFMNCKKNCVSTESPFQTTYIFLGWHHYQQHYPYQPHKTAKGHWGQSLGLSNPRSVAPCKLSQRSFPWVRPTKTQISSLASLQ